MSLLEKILNVLEDRIDLTTSNSSSLLLAITVPATLFSAISFARLGPLKTPTVLFILDKITSESGLKGLSRMPLVHEIK